MRNKGPGFLSYTCILYCKYNSKSKSSPKRLWKGSRSRQTVKDITQTQGESFIFRIFKYIYFLLPYIFLYIRIPGTPIESGLHSMWFSLLKWQFLFPQSWKKYYSFLLKNVVYHVLLEARGHHRTVFYYGSCWKL